jgi:hypothetical protein
MRRTSRSCAALLGAVLVVVDVRSSAPAGADDAAVLVEATTCARATPLPAPGAGRTGGDTVVSFAVTNETRLRVDGDGAVTSASTNTGCHPRRADRMVVLGDDGGRRAARVTEVAIALTGFRSGDWRAPGVWHDRD